MEAYPDIFTPEYIREHMPEAADPEGRRVAAEAAAVAKASVRSCHGRDERTAGGSSSAPLSAPISSQFSGVPSGRLRQLSPGLGSSLLLRPESAGGVGGISFLEVKGSHCYCHEPAGLGQINMI
jgi:hypothetical protein